MEKQQEKEGELIGMRRKMGKREEEEKVPVRGPHVAHLPRILPP